MGIRQLLRNMVAAPSARGPEAVFDASPSEHFKLLHTLRARPKVFADALRAHLKLDPSVASACARALAELPLEPAAASLCHAVLKDVDPQLQDAAFADCLRALSGASARPKPVDVFGER